MTLLSRMIDGKRLGGGQLPWVETLNPVEAAVVAGTLTANLAFFYRFRVGRPMLVTKLSVYVGTASGNLDLGIYSSADGGTTLTREGSTGSTAVAGTNAVQTVTLGTAIRLLPGFDYWLALAVDNGTATIGRPASVVAAVDAVDNEVLTKATSFPLPASVASLTAGSTLSSWIRASE